MGKIKKIKNRSGQIFVKNLALNTIFPVSLYEKGEEVDVEYYPHVSFLIYKFLKKHKENLTKEDTLSELIQRLNKKYRKEKFEFSVTKGYKMTPSASEYGNYILPTTRALDESALKEDNYLDFPLSDYIDAKRHGFITVVDGKIVSIAVLNEDLDSQDILDFGIETKEEYRGEGYALSCAAALTKFLLEKGKSPYVQVDIDNIPSINLFEKLGYIKESNYYHLMGERS